MKSTTIKRLKSYLESNPEYKDYFLKKNVQKNYEGLFALLSKPLKELDYKEKNEVYIFLNIMDFLLNNPEIKNKELREELKSIKTFLVEDKNLFASQLLTANYLLSGDINQIKEILDQSIQFLKHLKNFTNSQSKELKIQTVMTMLCKYYPFDNIALEHIKNRLSEINDSDTLEIVSIALERRQHFLKSFDENVKKLIKAPEKNLDFLSEVITTLINEPAAFRDFSGDLREPMIARLEPYSHLIQSFDEDKMTDIIKKISTKVEVLSAQIRAEESKNVHLPIIDSLQAEKNKYESHLNNLNIFSDVFLHYKNIKLNSKITEEKTNSPRALVSISLLKTEIESLDFYKNYLGSENNPKKSPSNEENQKTHHEIFELLNKKFNTLTKEEKNKVFVFLIMAEISIKNESVQEEIRQEIKNIREDTDLNSDVLCLYGLAYKNANAVNHYLDKQIDKHTNPILPVICKSYPFDNLVMNVINENITDAKFSSKIKNAIKPIEKSITIRRNFNADFEKNSMHLLSNLEISTGNTIFLNNLFTMSSNEIIGEATDEALQLSFLSKLHSFSDKIAALSFEQISHIETQNQSIEDQQSKFIYGNFVAALRKIHGNENLKQLTSLKSSTVKNLQNCIESTFVFHEDREFYKKNFSLLKKYLNKEKRNELTNDEMKQVFVLLLTSDVILKTEYKAKIDLHLDKIKNKINDPFLNILHALVSGNPNELTEYLQSIHTQTTRTISTPFIASEQITLEKLGVDSTTLNTMIKTGQTAYITKSGITITHLKKNENGLFYFKTEETIKIPDQEIRDSKRTVILNMISKCYPFDDQAIETIRKNAEKITDPETKEILLETADLREDFNNNFTTNMQNFLRQPSTENSQILVSLYEMIKAESVASIDGKSIEQAMRARLQRFSKNINQLTQEQWDLLSQYSNESPAHHAFYEVIYQIQHNNVSFDVDSFRTQLNSPDFYMDYLKNDENNTKSSTIFKLLRKDNMSNLNAVEINHVFSFLIMANMSIKDKKLHNDIDNVILEIKASRPDLDEASLLLHDVVYKKHPRLENENEATILKMIRRSHPFENVLLNKLQSINNKKTASAISKYNHFNASFKTNMENFFSELTEKQSNKFLEAFFDVIYDEMSLQEITTDDLILKIENKLEPLAQTITQLSKKQIERLESYHFDTHRSETAFPAFKTAIENIKKTENIKLAAMLTLDTVDNLKYSLGTIYNEKSMKQYDSIFVLLKKYLEKNNPLIQEEINQVFALLIFSKDKLKKSKVPSNISDMIDSLKDKVDKKLFILNELIDEKGNPNLLTGYLKKHSSKNPKDVILDILCKGYPFEAYEDILRHADKITDKNTKELLSQAILDRYDFLSAINPNRNNLFNEPQKDNDPTKTVDNIAKNKKLIVTIYKMTKSEFMSTPSLESIKKAIKEKLAPMTEKILACKELQLQALLSIEYSSPEDKEAHRLFCEIVQEIRNPSYAASVATTPVISKPTLIVPPTNSSRRAAVMRLQDHIKSTNNLYSQYLQKNPEAQKLHDMTFEYLLLLDNDKDLTEFKNKNKEFVKNKIFTCATIIEAYFKNSKKTGILQSFLNAEKSKKLPASDLGAFHTLMSGDPNDITQFLDATVPGFTISTTTVQISVKELEKLGDDEKLERGYYQSEGKHFINQSSKNFLTPPEIEYEKTMRILDVISKGHPFNELVLSKIRDRADFIKDPGIHKMILTAIKKRQEFLDAMNNKEFMKDFITNPSKDSFILTFDKRLAAELPLDNQDQDAYLDNIMERLKPYISDITSLSEIEFGKIKENSEMYQKFEDYSIFTRFISVLEKIREANPQAAVIPVIETQKIDNGFQPKKSSSFDNSKSDNKKAISATLDLAKTSAVRDNEKLPEYLQGKRPIRKKRKSEPVIVPPTLIPAPQAVVPVENSNWFSRAWAWLTGSNTSEQQPSAPRVSEKSGGWRTWPILNLFFSSSKEKKIIPDPSKFEPTAGIRTVKRNQPTLTFTAQGNNRLTSENSAENNSPSVSEHLNNNKKATSHR